MYEQVKATEYLRKNSNAKEYTQIKKHERKAYTGTQKTKDNIKNPSNIIKKIRNLLQNKTKMPGQGGEGVVIFYYFLLAMSLFSPSSVLEGVIASLIPLSFSGAPPQTHPTIPSSISQVTI
jgi:hypothetical protein